MDTLNNIFTTGVELSHAYLLVGNPTKIEEELCKFLNETFGTGFVSVSNPDFRIIRMMAWGVENSREFNSFNSRHSISGSVKVSVIVSETISAQAQNSLLKTIEEPTPGTHLFIISRSLREFLPTLLSRCQVHKLEYRNFDDDVIENVNLYLSGDISERFNMSKKIIKDQEQNPSYPLVWLNCLLDEYWKKHTSQMSDNFLMGAQELSKAIEYAGAPGNSLRLILEHLAGVVPVL